MKDYAAINITLNSVLLALKNRSSKYRVGPLDWPYLLWANEKVDPFAYDEGFMRNRRLIFVRVLR